MAQLLSMQSSTHLYLKSYHRFGRLQCSVDTFLNYRQMSRMHAIIEWLKNDWFIRDLSKNGVWLNGKRIQPNQSCKLDVNDKLYFAGITDETFKVIDLDQPRDVLIPCCTRAKQHQPFQQAVCLNRYHFLPTESSPEIVVFFDGDEEHWYCEHVSDMTSRQIPDGEYLKFADSIWQLVKCTVLERQSIRFRHIFVRHCED